MKSKSQNFYEFIVEAHSRTKINLLGLLYSGREYSFHEIANYLLTKDHDTDIGIIIVSINDLLSSNDIEMKAVEHTTKYKLQQKPLTQDVTTGYNQTNEPGIIFHK